MKDRQQIKTIIIAILTVLLINLLYPLAVIWAINTLFPNTIEVTVVNWLAVLVIIMIVFKSKPNIESK